MAGEKVRKVRKVRREESLKGVKSEKGWKDKRRTPSSNPSATNLR